MGVRIMAGKIRPWQRDFALWGDLARWPMTTSQIADLHGFPSRKKTAERLYQHYDAGEVTRIPFLLCAKQGKPEFAYARKGVRLQSRTLLHTIGIADVYVQSSIWARASGWSVEFYFTHELPVCGGIIPDATLILRKEGKAGLFYVEVDNDTEPMTSASGYSLAKKLALYAAYFDGEAYLRDFAFAGTFQGFRVCLLVPENRLRPVQRLASEQGHDFVLSATLDDLKQGFGRPVWRTHENALVNLFGRGEVLGELVGEMIEPPIPSTQEENSRCCNEFAAEPIRENPTVTNREGEIEERGDAGQS
jgi:hypothetical protein